MLGNLSLLTRIANPRVIIDRLLNNSVLHSSVRQYRIQRTRFYPEQNMASGGEGVSVWYQREISVPAKRRGCHYISEEILKACRDELSHIKVGVAHIHIKHTSASIILNENFDPTVLTDMEMVLNKLAPESLNYKHTMEGPDDMPAHAKAAMMGSSVTVPITNGKFNLGTWQGVWLCEHRDHGGSRKLVVTINGLKK